MHTKDPLPFFLIVTIAAICIVALGPSFATIDPWLRYLSTLGTLVGGIGTPIAIVVAFRMHRETIDSPRTEAQLRAHSVLWFLVTSVPEQLGSFLNEIYKRHNSVSAAIDGVFTDNDAFEFELVEYYRGRIKERVDQLYSDLSSSRHLILALEPEKRDNCLSQLQDIQLTRDNLNSARARPDLGYVPDIARIEMIIEDICIFRDLLAVPEGIISMDIDYERQRFEIIRSSRNEFWEVENVRDILRPESEIMRYPFRD